MKIGAVIQQERTRLGLSQEKLAEQLGVSRQAVSKWELGDAVPDTDKLVPWLVPLASQWTPCWDNQPPQAEEKPKETGERQPGWLALHWYWIGVPLSLWGAARSSVVFATMTMMGFAINFLVFLPDLLLPLSALVGGLALFVQGRRSVRRRYSLKPLTPPPGKGPRELIARRWCGRAPSWQEAVRWGVRCGWPRPKPFMIVYKTISRMRIYIRKTLFGNISPKSRRSISMGRPTNR